MSAQINKEQVARVASILGSSPEQALRVAKGLRKLGAAKTCNKFPGFSAHRILEANNYLGALNLVEVPDRNSRPFREDGFVWSCNMITGFDEFSLAINTRDVSHALCILKVALHDVAVGRSDTPRPIDLVIQSLEHNPRLVQRLATAIQPTMTSMMMAAIHKSRDLPDRVREKAETVARYICSMRNLMKIQLNPRVLRTDDSQVVVNIDIQFQLAFELGGGDSRDTLAEGTNVPVETNPNKFELQAAVDAAPVGHKAAALLAQMRTAITPQNKRRIHSEIANSGPPPATQREVLDLSGGGGVKQTTTTLKADDDEGSIEDLSPEDLADVTASAGSPSKDVAKARQWWSSHLGLVHPKLEQMATDAIKKFGGDGTAPSKADVPALVDLSYRSLASVAQKRAPSFSGHFGVDEATAGLAILLQNHLTKVLTGAVKVQPLVTASGVTSSAKDVLAVLNQAPLGADKTSRIRLASPEDLEGAVHGKDVANARWLVLARNGDTRTALVAQADTGVKLLLGWHQSTKTGRVTRLVTSPIPSSAPTGAALVRSVLAGLTVAPEAARVR